MTLLNDPFHKTPIINRYYNDCNSYYKFQLSKLNFMIKLAYKAVKKSTQANNIVLGMDL